MIERVVEPEILDGLPSDDVEAVRSRLDLQMINHLMGNERWIVKQVEGRREDAAEGVVEIGAGSGLLLRKLAGVVPGCAVSGLDLVARPVDLPGSIGWRQGDLFEEMSGLGGGVLVANLMLHHFEEEQLRRLRPLVERFRSLCLVEPLRRVASMVCGGVMLPLVNRVTRHDMMVSIRAGFLPGELGDLLGLDEARWEIFESCSWRGGIRVLACRR